MSNNLEFTKLNYFYTTNRNPFQPAQQVVDFVENLQGKIKEGFQVVPLAGNQLLLIFEMEDGQKPKAVQGFGKEVREIQKGNNINKSTKRKSK